MKENYEFTCLGVFVFAVLSLVIGSVMGGWVLSVLWGWFVQPIFNVPSLSIPLAIGFSMVVGFLTKQPSSTSGSKDKEISSLIAEVIVYSILYPLFTLFFGWVVLQFI